MICSLLQFSDGTFKNFGANAAMHLLRNFNKHFFHSVNKTLTSVKANQLQNLGIEGTSMDGMKPRQDGNTHTNSRRLSTSVKLL